VAEVEAVAGSHPSSARGQCHQSVVSRSHGHQHAAEMAASKGLSNYHGLESKLGEHYLRMVLANGGAPSQCSGLLDHLEYLCDDDCHSIQYDLLNRSHGKLRCVTSARQNDLLK